MSGEDLSSSHQLEWERRRSSSCEVKEARTSLEFQRRKIRQLHEALISAECLEGELEGRLVTVKNKVKPTVMKFVEKLKDYDGVELALIEKVVEEVPDPKKIISSVRKETISVSQMDRTQLLGHLNTLRRLCSCFRQKEVSDGVENVQVMHSYFL